MNEITPPTAWTPDGEKPMAAASNLPTEDALIEAISTVYDPEIPVNIYELGLIYAVEIADDGAVKVEMTLTAPACPSAQELPEQVQQAVLCAGRRDVVSRRNGLGSAVGSVPHDRGSPAAVEYVLIDRDIGWTMSTTTTAPRKTRALPPLMTLTDAAAERLRGLYEKGEQGQAAAHRREDQGLLRHVLRHVLDRCAGTER